MLFDRPLRKGETVITEHELVNSAPYPPATNYERKFRLPVREFVLEICFDPDRSRSTASSYSQLDEADELAVPVEPQRLGARRRPELRARPVRLPLDLAGQLK